MGEIYVHKQRRGKAERRKRGKRGEAGRKERRMRREGSAAQKWKFEPKKRVELRERGDVQGNEGGNKKK